MKKGEPRKARGAKTRNSRKKATSFDGKFAKLRLLKNEFVGGRLILAGETIKIPKEKADSLLAATSGVFIKIV